MADGKNVYVVMRYDWEEGFPLAVYAKKGAANKRAKELDAEQPPRTTPYADSIERYAHRVEMVVFHA